MILIKSLPLVRRTRLPSRSFVSYLIGLTIRLPPTKTAYAGKHLTEGESDL
jgi:hypothetical protein